jgi:membrane protein required for colicin V production
MNWTDYLIVAVLALSVLIGLWRGLISEVLALAIWIAAFWVAMTFGPTVAAFFEHSISLPSARYLVGYGLCFIAVLLAGALLRFVVSRLIESTGLSGTDRLLGMVFGLARGVLLVTLAVFLIGFTAFTRDPWWRQSALVPQFQGMAMWLGEWVPASVRPYLQRPANVLEHLPHVPVGALPGASSAPARGASVSAVHP